MVTYNNQHDPQRENPGSFPGGWGALLPGLILVGMGALFLLGNLHVVRVAEWFAYWPVILIAIGLVQLVDANHPGRRVAGGVLLGLGGLFLADNLGYLAIRVEDLWPLILIGIGVMMLWTRFSGGSSIPWDRYSGAHRRWGDGGMSNPGLVNETAVFGGSRRIITDQDFKGGRLTALFGGINLDLTAANIAGNPAVLELHMLYGGATVRVPASWNVELRGAGIFGGLVDRTVHPPYSPDGKRLIVRGAVIFGGVTIRN